MQQTFRLNQETKKKAFSELEALNANVYYAGINTKIIKRGIRILIIVSTVNIILTLINLIIK